MIIYCNSRGVIYDVGENTTGNNDLIRIEIDDEDNPFAEWSKGKICCYRVEISNGKVTMMTPAVDSRIIRNFDINSKQTEEIKPYKESKIAYYGDNEVTFYNVPAGNLSVFIKDCEGNCPNYTVTHIGNIVNVTFDTVHIETTVTISVQR